MGRSEFTRFQKGMDKASVILELDQYKTEEKYRTSVFRGKFKVIAQDDLSPDIIRELTNEVERVAEASLTDDIIEIKIYAYLEVPLLMSRLMKSAIYRCTRMAVLKDAFRTRGFDNVLISPIPGDDIDDRIIPYKNLLQSVSELDRVDGIYMHPYLTVL